MKKRLRKLSFLFILLILCSSKIFSQDISIDTNFNNIIRKNSGGWVAADATYSILLPDNRTLWLFGDTFIGETNNEGGIKPGSTMIRNSAIIMDGDSLRSLYNGTFENPIDFIPTDNPDLTWYWPEHGTVENDLLIIFLAKFTTDPEAPPGWNFKYVGQDVAYFSYPEIEFIEIKELPFYAKNGVMYGPRIMNKNEFTYIYGRKEEDLNGFKLPYPHVARIKNGSKNEWEFFDGEGWLSSPESTAPMIDFPVSQQFGVFKHLNKYILITQDIWLSPKIYSFTSESPVGPWENKKLLYTTPILFENSFTYNAYPHPQFNENNELLLSYNTNGDFWDIFTNVELYRPNFIRIPYELIDDDFKINSSTKIEQNSCKVYPNPVKDSFTLLFYHSESDAAKFTLNYLNGSIAKTFLFDNLSPGNQIKNLDINELSSGIYIGVLSTKSNIKTLKIIK